MQFGHLSYCPCVTFDLHTQRHTHAVLIVAVGEAKLKCQLRVGISSETHMILSDILDLSAKRRKHTETHSGWVVCRR